MKFIENITRIYKIDKMLAVLKVYEKEVVKNNIHEEER